MGNVVEGNSHPATTIRQSQRSMRDLTLKSALYCMNLNVSNASVPTNVPMADVWRYRWWTAKKPLFLRTKGHLIC